METARPLFLDRDRPRLDLPNLLWFFGAITAVIASIAVLDKVPESSSDVWLLLASFGFFVAYALAALLLYRRGRWIPAGLMATVSAAMVPAVGYAFTQLVGLYPDDSSFDPFSDFSGTILGIGIATALIALIAYALTGFSFLLALFVTAALLSVQLLTPAWSTTGDDRALSGILSGAAAVVAGLLLDAAAKRRDAFWFYVGGYFAVGAALVYYVVNGYGNDGGPSSAWLALLIVGAVVLLGGALLRRATWAAYGALGLYGALAHYLSAHDWTRYLLLAVSLGVFALGLAVAVQRRPTEPAGTSES
jgi:hypothetical protein